MKDLRRKAPEPESDSQQVQAFLTQMEGLIARHPLWANSTPEELEIATEVGNMQTLVVVGSHNEMAAPATASCSK
jgi:hypothetical protein